MDADTDADTEVSDFNVKSNATITEKRKYVLHKKIERNGTAAKKHHGTVCQACNLDFSDRYGDIGQGFIEAHHLTPISTLTEGVAVRYNIAKDFAVLCSNCHRMIHRTDDPSDIIAFRARLTSQRNGA